MRYHDRTIAGRVPPSDPPVLSNGHITFGAFNRSTKITGEVVALWARILHAVPQSRLLLKHYGFDQPAVRTTTLEKFTSHGVAADRIAFLGATSRADHLAAFKNVDIALDPFPQNGGISTFETLQMGVPTVTMLGKTIPSRIAGAILTAVGLGGWVAEDADGYLAIATKFAAMPEHLGALRREFARQALQAVPQTNNVLYTKAVENGVPHDVAGLLPLRDRASFGSLRFFAPPRRPIATARTDSSGFGCPMSTR